MCEGRTLRRIKNYVTIKIHTTIYLSLFYASKKNHPTYNRNVFHHFYILYENGRLWILTEAVIPDSRNVLGHAHGSLRDVA